MKKLLLVAAVLALGVVASQAETVFTETLDTDFNNAGNWDNGLPDADGTAGGADLDAVIALGSTAVTSASYGAGGGIHYNLDVLGTLSISAGHTVGLGSGLGWDTGTDLTVDGGILNLDGTVTVLGGNADTFVLNGGIINVNSGGQLNAVKALEIINGTVIYASGSTASGPKDEVVVDNNGFLAFQTDGATIATIAGGTIAVELGSTSTLDMQLGGSYAVNDTWTIINGVTLGFSGVDGGDGTGVFGTVYDSTNPDNKFSVDYSGTTAVVTLTAIPEPATLGMVALFGGGLLFIRKRMMI